DRGRAQDGALWARRSPEDRAAAPVRPRRARASGEARTQLRRGPHRVVSLFLAPRGRSAAAGSGLPLRCRLARDLDPGVLARVSRRSRWGRRLASTEAVRADPAACVLFLAAARASVA